MFCSTIVFQNPDRNRDKRWHEITQVVANLYLGMDLIEIKVLSQLYGHYINR